MKGKLYIWAINDSWHAGVPDHYYSGSKTDLWVEYKFYPTDRELFDLSKSEKNPKLSCLQQNWLNARYKEGRNVWVIVGMPSGGVILRNQDWTHKVTITRLLSRKELAQEILCFCVAGV